MYLIALQVIKDLDKICRAWIWSGFQEFDSAAILSLVSPQCIVQSSKTAFWRLQPVP